MSTFLEALDERVLIFDGAMGTEIQARGLSVDDYWGHEGNSEVLLLSRPDVIRAIHASYLEAGADCIETNTFGANALVQDEYGMGDRVHELNVVAARLAREAASSFSDRPRWVAGSIGPGTKAPSLGQATFDDLERSYRAQALGLIEGGVDALVIETAYDLLQVKAAIAAVAGAFEESRTHLPVIVQVTVEATGQMLLGSEIGAALATIEPFGIVKVVGLNCATGPVEMTEHVRYLCAHSRKFVSVLPNAGLPEVRDGRTVYSLTPEEFVAHHRLFVEEFGANVVGGCCGTTPEHIRRLAEALRDRPRPHRAPQFEPACASLYIAQPLRQETSFFVVGERCNAQGSKRFRGLVEAGDWDHAVEVAKEQVREGAHGLDISVDMTGRDGVADMAAVVSELRSQVTLPLFLDSTEPSVLEAGLKLIGGRPVINSINLEEGRGPGSRIDRTLRLARRFGAAVIAMAIDERGQATTRARKLDACRAVFEVATGEYGLEPHDLIFDPLVLPISTGMEEGRRAALETLDAVAALGEEFPDSFTSLGVSNVSFGLSPAARQALNSMFLHEAVARGLSMAIMHPGQILPTHRIEERARAVALDLVYDRRREGYDPLAELIVLFEGVSGTRTGAGEEELSALPLAERLTRRIVDGARKGLEADLDDALADHPALEIIDRFLLPGMKLVGEQFASGEMQLPFVLQSAETMKVAVSHLEPHMERAGDGSKGRIVLATVKGDVHDIGKNLVDIILTNNGYSVENLGIKQPIGAIVEAAERAGADAIGLSGLLVKSTVVMREDLEEMNRRGLHGYPVLLGGAALTRAYVENDLRALYRGRVFYGRDAFEGLRIMDGLMAEKRGEAAAPVEAAPRPRRARRPAAAAGARRSDVAIDVQVPHAPFHGSRIAAGLSIQEVARYLNRVSLYQGRWQVRRRRGQSAEEFEASLARTMDPVLRDVLARSVEERILAPAVVYGYFACASEGNDLIVYDDDGRERARFGFPRQSRGRRLCIADFFRPVESGERDVVALQVVTMGPRASEVAAELFRADRYTDYLYLHGLSVEMAEALAEMWHRRVREELGIAGLDAATVEGILKAGYRGCRYSFGYPACPGLEDQKKILELLEPERIGVRLSEEFQLAPEQSTSAIIVHHPEARYFSVGRAAISGGGE
ncbi:MAG: methionine synthase [Acidobacteria bacterium]|nr:methionine synthase [Acidobacteriota bacterium]